MIVFFFFFFENVHENPLIREAFRQICAKKLFSDMYCDMDEYLSARIDKRVMAGELMAIHSPLEELYRRPYPTLEDANTMWEKFEYKMYCRREAEFLDNEEAVGQGNKVVLEYIEAKAIVNWIYHIYPGMDKRKDVTKSILDWLSEVYKLDELEFADTIIYIRSRVEINPISSFGGFCKIVQEFDSPKNTFYYRGHSDSNYVLLPSIMRTKGWILHEREMYNELLIECPQDFEGCITHLDKLVHMQHYGMPTRLLDITRNPLVALYFACSENSKKQGEVLVFSVENSAIRYPGSDTVSILASLPLLPMDIKDSLVSWAKDVRITPDEFNKRAARLLHEVQLEKPAFRQEIVKSDVLDCFFVLSEKRNNRIIKQDGAFIICGLLDEKKNPINQYRYKERKKIQVFIIKANAKAGILKQLNRFSINQASLFPEFSDVANYVKSKY